MKKLSLILIIILFAASYSVAQDASYEKAKKLLYENFDSDGFMKMSDQLIKEGKLSDSLVISLYEMRTVVYYMNGDEQSIRNCFKSILSIRKKYIPDPEIISDRLIPIFEEVRAEYLKTHPDIIQPKDTTQTKQELKTFEPHTMRTAVTQNLILPGWGKIYLGEETKGWITATVSAINIGALVYYAFDAKSKEDAYLKETNKYLVQQKYNDYNTSFKTRNILIASYIAIWLYSQIDLLFFSNDFEISAAPQTSFIQSSPLYENGLQIKFQIPLH